MKKKGFPGPVFLDATLLELAIQDFARRESHLPLRIKEMCEELAAGRSRTLALFSEKPIGVNAAIQQGYAMLEKIGF